ncbi:type I restriction endonuclease subunit R [bacterium]|nr:type I restriction endonuclease subunit R [bacterium]
MPNFPTQENPISQLPAVQLLVQLGYTYIPPAEALAERQNRTSNVILESILRTQLKAINRIQHKGSEYLFSEENIQSAIQKLKNIRYDGLLRTNEVIYDLITLGTSFEQTIEGDSKSFNLNYIDWRNPDRNQFHVTVEFSVERSRSTETIRPDIVLFVNGIPLGVIECKSPDIPIDQAISQSVRNQTDDYIPRLFVYTQLLLATNKNEAMVATTGTAAKFWSVWKEPNMAEGEAEYTRLQTILGTVLPESFVGNMSKTLGYQLDKTPQPRLITVQDQSIFSLCRPDRLLELIWKFTVFDGGVKKIARYQQYFVIKSTLDRVKNYDHSGARQGGMIWHTQGSGKSLTMVMLARNIMLAPGISTPRIVLVTDRDDLDKQLGNTFIACGVEAKRATSGRNLLELVSEGSSGIITTLIHKFEKAFTVSKYHNDSTDVFVVVDESHRTQFGSFAARMRQLFPKACYLGFTGTPLLKAEKNNFLQFGTLIQPYYSIRQAVDDGAVVPLLYEGRHVEMTQNQVAIDLWFERHTQGLNSDQKADLKRKYAKAEMLNKSDQVIYMRAFDISEHFRATWQEAHLFKAQLVAPNKRAALKYHDYLNEIGLVTSAVVISPPDVRENYEDTDDESTDEVVNFWNKMMKRYGSEDAYNRELVNQFKNGAEPEILIVVDKLLTGFDAPTNTILYLCRTLKEHTLLQAIARVNRLHDGKDFGFIVDYANILQELGEALTSYSALQGFDELDLVGTLTSINSEINKLPGLYSHLWDLFNPVKRSHDEEEYERLLADADLRDDFYDRLSAFGKTLSIALSAQKFLEETDDAIISRYKNDFRRFMKLKQAVKLRYADAVDYRDYEPKIKKLLDTHIQANEVGQIIPPVNIFDDDLFNQIKESQGIYTQKSKGAIADTIAHATKKVITERMDEDPAFYEKFSRLIQIAIEDFNAKRITDIEYLKTVVDIRNRVAGQVHDNIPDGLAGNDDAIAYFGILESVLERSVAAETALAIQDIFKTHYKVLFWDDEDAQKQVLNDIDDYFYDDLKMARGIEIPFEQVDDVIDKIMKVTKHRGTR